MRLLSSWLFNFWHRIFRLGCLITTIALSNAAAAEIIFTAPPQLKREQAIEIYGPFIRYLELVIGESVVFEYPAGWQEYSENMRADHYDIIFDAPHFSSWRIKNIDHVPVARLPGTLNYVIVANQYDKSVESIRDLVGVKICSLASPSLGTMAVYSLFDNSVNLPQIHEVNGEFANVYQALKNDKCKAAVLRDVDFMHMLPAEKATIKVVAKTASMPEHTLTVSSRLSKKKRMLTMMLTSPEGAKAADNIFRQYGSTQREFIATEDEEYNDLDGLLSHVVWGW